MGSNARGREGCETRVVRVAVVGHVEWVEFARVERIPAAGDIAHATDVWAEAAGGGSVAAVQLVRLAGEATLFTVLGNDELGRRARKQLTAQGVTVRAVVAKEPQRRPVTLVHGSGERKDGMHGPEL